MSSPSTRIVNRLAGPALEPLGLARLRSRLWIADHGWWLVGAVLESPSYSQGLRPTVFADFMWGYPDVELEDGSSYEPSLSFGVRAPLLHAERRPDYLMGCEWVGVSESFEVNVSKVLTGVVGELREWQIRFATIADWAPYLRSATTRADYWSFYRAAIATALAGDLRDAHARFTDLVAMRDFEGTIWFAAAHADTVALLGLLAHPEQFRDALVTRALRRRQALGCHALDRSELITALAARG